MDQIISTLSSLAPMILLFGVMYFLLIRPQKKREKKQKDMINAVREGEEIVTIGGISAKIININDDDLTIETSIDKTKILIKRWAIREVKQPE